ncbi:hypothetical protein HNY73_022060 [Argiope bruennichi]|uniref:Uncharacterized protein n=1 Tax=Argiope bruennichi TaxID=94029 RepID=A0A8T0DZP6_ARGBR|nr:hypothetical protein HNY73_022060 [Argiope bruennichi]
MRHWLPENTNDKGELSLHRLVRADIWATLAQITMNLIAENARNVLQHSDHQTWLPMRIPSHGHICVTVFTAIDCCKRLLMTLTHKYWTSEE